MEKEVMEKLLGKGNYGGRGTGVPYGETIVQSNRSIMWATTLHQAVSLKNNEIPGVMSYGHNEVFQSFRNLDKDVNKILHVLKDEVCNISYVIYENERGLIELKKVLPYEHANENYGFGNIINDPKEETHFAVQTSDFVGDEGIPSIFIDANVLYASQRGTYEDAVHVTDVFAERAKVIKVEPIQLIVSMSDMFRRLHDGEVVPQINKQMTRDDNILVAYTRDIRQYLRGDINKVKDTDRIKVYSEGSFLSSIEIEYHNVALDKPNAFSKYILSDYTTKQDIYAILKNIENLATSARIFLSKFEKLVDNSLQVDGNKVFLPTEMRITMNVVNFSPMTLGSKSMGRCGNKGVVSKVYEINDNDSVPYIEEGGVRIYADLVRTVYTENNRNNPIQFLEQITNRISDMLYTLKKDGKLTRDILLEYFGLLCGPGYQQRFRDSDMSVDDMFDGKRLINVIDEDQPNLYYKNYKEIQEFLQKYFDRGIRTPIYKDVDGHKIQVGFGYISREAIYVTKQDAKSGASLYEDGNRNSFGNPRRSNAKKMHEAHSKSTPIQMGVNDVVQFTNVLTEDELQHHLDKGGVRTVEGLSAYIQALGFNTTF